MNFIRSGPPSIPLPQTPTSSEVLLSLLRQTSNTELEATSTQKLIARPRAHTIGSLDQTIFLSDRNLLDLQAGIEDDAVDDEEDASDDEMLLDDEEQAAVDIDDRKFG